MRRTEQIKERGRRERWRGGVTYEEDRSTSKKEDVETEKNGRTGDRRGSTREWRVRCLRLNCLVPLSPVLKKRGREG